jgi:trk system potassium uptake protein TrkH
LSRWYNDPVINFIFIGLILLGGIGFYVLVETYQWAVANTFKRNRVKRVRLSWYSKVVLQTSLYLVIGGTIVIFFAEFVLQKHQLSFMDSLLVSLFQAVSCRTAGFDTIPISQLTNVTMLLMMILMFIGAAPGSCAGGIKVTSFRVVLAFIAAELRGREQAVINGMAITRDSVRRAIAILVFSLVIVGVAILAISITDTGNLTHNESRGHFLNIAFEVVSAYGTAGISTGITPDLSQIDKYIIMCLMYLGRLGPLIFLGVLHTIRRPELFSRPETDILMG